VATTAADADADVDAAAETTTEAQPTSPLVVTDRGLTGRPPRHRVAQTTRRVLMTVARVVSFEGVTKERVEEIKQEMQGGERPEGLPATEILLLHDADAESALVVLFFDSDEDYAQGDETLNAMSSDETPGRRAGVTKYDVAVRMTA
jgi:hypothetical protein